MLPIKTREAARIIGVTLGQLMGALRTGKVAPPAKDSSGDFIWAEADLERAQAALAVDLRRKQPIAAPLVSAGSDHGGTSGAAAGAGAE